MLIDVSHADATTLLNIAALTRQPIVASHAGAKAIEPFARFLGDAEIDAVSATGGLVGLWPYRYKSHGATDLNALVEHASYIAQRRGVEHLCLGTDMNALPGVPEGYRGEQDVRLIANHLRAAGFGRRDIEAVMGGNFMRVLEQVTDSA
jgi:membrane dipeptidase